MATLATIDNTTWGISNIGYGVIVEGIALIRQRISIALRTTKGSDPLRPEFGSNIYKFFDLPLTIAIPNIKAEIISSLQLWLPEIKLTAITHFINSASNPVFEIAYNVVDDTLTDKLLFDLKQPNVTGTTASEIILQAFFPPNPNGYSYNITLIKNSVALNPTPPLSGFSSIQQLFEWVKANWFFWGRWVLVSDRIILYMKSEGVENATLSVSILPITFTEAIFPQLPAGKFYKIIFLINQQQASPEFPKIFSTPGEVLTWVQNNWSLYGDWQIEGMPANNNSSFSDEFSLEFDAPNPDTFKLTVLTKENVSYYLLITTT